jgi:hypothetical protein
MKNIFDKKAREAAKAQAKIDAEKAKTRKPEEVSAQYNRLCAELGDKAYRVKVLESEIEQINQTLYGLNQEFHKATAVHAPQTPKPTEAQQTAAKAMVEQASRGEAQSEAQPI